MAEKDVEQRYTANLQGEVDGAALYRTLSQTEKNPQLAEVYGRLGAVEAIAPLENSNGGGRDLVEPSQGRSGSLPMGRIPCMTGNKQGIFPKIGRSDAAKRS